MQVDNFNFKNKRTRRSPFFNVREESFYACGKDISLKIFESMCLVQQFELYLMKAVNEKKVTIPVYLSSGQESVASALSLEVKDYQIFAQHRAHDIYLTFGGSPEMLRDEMLGLLSGTSQGKAGSNCLQYHMDGMEMYGHHGLIGENVPMAVGAALANNKKTLCVFGDGAAEEDYVSSALGFAATHKLPVLFICLDNDLSILTPTAVRRNWNIADLAASMNIPSLDISDDPWEVLYQTKKITQNLPALINCRTCRKYWHVGTGNDGEPEWDRYKLSKNKLMNVGLDTEIEEIELKISHYMEKLWDLK